MSWRSKYTRIDDLGETYPDPERPPKKNHPRQLETNNVYTYDVATHSDTDCISVGKIPSSNVHTGYDIKPSDSEALVLELWGIWRTPLLLLLPVPV